MRVYVKGFGCSSSLADAEVLAGCLSEAGHALVGDVQAAELVIYNTCAVKAQTENRMVNMLRSVPREKKLIVAGCLPVVNFARLRREVRFDGAVGPAFGEKIVDVVARVSKGMSAMDLGDAVASMPRLGLSRVRVNPRISIIPINYGCLGECSYCCVRLARGKLRSYSVEEVAARVERDFAEGVCEFWLTSQDTACYGRDIGTDLAALLESVCDIEGVFLVRVGMMTPNKALALLDKLIVAFRDEKVFKFLHLPLQSGDDGVLEQMGRLYSAEDFVTVVERFRTAFPQLTIATDVIVGFPGETEEAFKQTCGLIERIRPDIINVSKFFARPNTPAVSLKPQVSPPTVKDRSALLAGLARRISLERNRRWVGWSGRVFIDEFGKSGSVVGRNFAYKPVVIKSDNSRNSMGHFVSAKIADAFQSYLLAEKM